MNQPLSFVQTQTPQLGGVLTPMPVSQDMRLSGVSDEVLYHAVVDLVNKAPNPDALRESLSVRLAKDRGVDTYGARMHDQLGAASGEKPAHLDMTPYARSAAGATAAVTYTDPQTQEVYVLLGRKYKDSKKPELGFGEYIMPGGYMNPEPPVGSLPYQEAFDRDLSETVIRELKEETGLVLPQDYKPRSLGADSKVENNRYVHSVNEFFHVNMLGKQADMPVLQAADDLAALEWVNVKQIGVNRDITPQPDGSSVSRFSVLTPQGLVNLRDLHGEYLEKAVIQAKRELLAAPTVPATELESQTLPVNEPIISNKWQDYISNRRSQSAQATLSL